VTRAPAGDEEATTGVRGVMGTSTSLSASLRGTASPAARSRPARSPSPNARSAAAAAAPVGEDELVAVEASIIRQAFERRLRVADVFVDFDKLHRGTCTRAQFVRGLKLCAFEGLTPSQAEAVASKYVVPGAEPEGQVVCYAKFSAAVEEAFVPRGLEQDPSKTLDSFAHSVVSSPAPRFVRPTLEREDAVALQAALVYIKDKIRHWRLYNMKPVLTSFDKAAEGLITETQFLRVLAQFDLVPHPAHERGALLDYFRGKGSRAHMIDYRAFLAAAYEDGLA
jgi:hypothetical protein